MNNNDELGLPKIDSIEWYIVFLFRLNGFEWKGVFFRVQTEADSKNLFTEIKSLNYLFFEYIQIIDNIKMRNDPTNLLSNELIFPLITYVKTNGMVLFGSVCINKYFYDSSIIGDINTNQNYNQLKSQKKLKRVNSTHQRLTHKNNNNTIESPLIRYNPKNINSLIQSQNIRSSIDKNVIKSFKFTSEQ